MYTMYNNEKRNAGEAISAGYVLSLSTNDVVLADAATQATMAQTKVIGISAASAASGAACTYAVGGLVRAVAGDTIVEGDALVAQATTGKVIPFVTATYTDATTIWIIGTAKQDAAADGSVLVNVDPRPLCISK